MVLERGEVVQQGTPVEVAGRPRTDYVADLVGLNLYRGTAHGTVVSLDGGGSPRNAWRVTVTGVEQHAHTTRVRLDGVPPVPADVTTAPVADLRLQPGDELWAAVKATEVRAHPS